MKVMRWLSQGIFPLDALEREGLCSLSFADDDQRPSDRVLLTGISGMGKSTVLEMLARLWQAAEAALRGEAAKLPPADLAVLLTGVVSRPLLVICAAEEAFWRRAGEAEPGALLAGWIAGEARGWEAAALQGLCPPNMLLLNEAAQQRLPGAAALEAAFLALHSEAPEQCAALLTKLQQLLAGKQVVITGERVRVRLARGGEHALEKLSSGERRVLGLLLAVTQRLRPGGVLLVDEPEAHLHPSQILGFLTALERLALPGGGQLILTSHRPEVWRRYDDLGINLVLEEQA